jgi:membrane associated rhomboid family serine protease
MSYYRSTYGGGGRYYRPSFFGGFSFFPPVIKALLISNTVIWLLTDFFPFSINGVPVNSFITRFFALWPWGTEFWPWQLLTYMFLHGGFGHLFFNMLALWMFGMELENLWGSRRFLIYYLTCGLGAGVANLIVPAMIGTGAPTVGASGAVFGVLVAFGMLFPDRPIYIYFLLPIKAKFFVAAYIALELFYGVYGMQSGVAHFAHLGGAAVGFVLTIMMQRGYTFSDLWDRIRGEPRQPYGWRRTGRPADDEILDAKFFDIKTGHPLDRENGIDQEVIDAILDKINTSGYQSLTEEEKRILNEASKKIH